VAINPAVSSVSAFFPCYNDAPVIGSLVEQVHEVLRESVDDFEVIVVDDGSADDSVLVLHEVASRLPNVRIVEHGRNRGYGGALRSGIGAATKDWIFYTDGDGQYDPREVKLMVDAAARDVDVVQGYKVRRGDGVVRTVIGIVWHRAVAVLFNLPVRDTDCDFRLLRRDVVQELPFESTSGVFPVELVWRLKTASARFVEVPVHHYARAHGRSQFFRPWRIAATFQELGILWWELVALPRVRQARARRDERPRRSPRR
jgi:glycosyltransferase involved in cell wall biosynthesis